MADYPRPMRYPETGEEARGGTRQPMNESFAENLDKLCQKAGQRNRYQHDVA